MKFQAPKTLNEIQEAQLLPEDWYELRIAKEPPIRANKVLRDYAKANGLKMNDVEAMQEALAQANEENFRNDMGKYPSLNIMLPLRVVAPGDPLIDGRAFQVYLPLPHSRDNERSTPLGQLEIDSKMERIAAHMSAFWGDEYNPASAEIEFQPGQSAYFYIESAYDDYFKQNRNNISMNEPPRPVE